MPLDFSKVEPDYETLVAAIRRAEGGDKAKVPFGILSAKVSGEAEAKQVALNTAKNNYQRWVKAGQPGDYLTFLASRYVPESADPVGNKNWRKNVPAIYEQLSKLKTPPAPPVAPNPPAPEQSGIFSEPLPYVAALPRYIP